MVIVAVGEFLDLLQKSQLLKPEQLDQARNAVREGDDAAALAARLVEVGLLTRWQADEVLAQRSSFLLGRYKLIRRIEQECIGDVFLGEHVTMQRRVALQTIPPGTSQSGQFGQFLADARNIASLDHPNVVQAYSVDSDGDTYFLVMEYVEGRDLRQIVESGGPLSYKVAAEYVRQAAEGLQHGHNRKIIHGNLKPSNLLVSPKGTVKIANMGLGWLSGSSTGRDGNGPRPPETVDYLAPEQSSGDRTFDHRADIYSLGCTLYFLLTGRAPFGDGLLHERLMRHQSMQPESILAFRTDVPKALVEVCGKMMAKRPEERYESASAVAEALTNLPPPEPPPPKPAPEAKPASHEQRQKPEPPPRDARASAPAGAPSPSASAILAARRAALARAAAEPSGFLATTQEKVIAAVVVGLGLVAIAAILVPFLRDRRAAATAAASVPPAASSVPAAAKPSDNPPGAATQGNIPSLAFDFESGDLQGWRVVEGKFDYLVSGWPTFRNFPGQPYNKQGKYHLTTVETDSGRQCTDAMTGVVESPVFVLSKPDVSMLVGGGSADRTYVALCTRDGKEVRYARGSQSEKMRRVAWSVPELVGQPLFLRIVDQIGQPWGHITFDDFRAEGKIDPAATQQRFAKLDAQPAQPASATPAIAVPASASFVAYRTLPGVGNHQFAGSLGLDFDVLAPIWITEFGAFDSGQDGVAGALEVTLWSREGNTGRKLASLAFTRGDDGAIEAGTGSRFKRLATPLRLSPGAYTIAASGFSGSDSYSRADLPGAVNGTMDDGGGLIRGGASRWGEGAGFPAQFDPNSPNKWACATFKFQPAPTQSAAMPAVAPPPMPPAGPAPPPAPPPPTETAPILPHPQTPKTAARADASGNLVLLNMPFKQLEATGNLAAIEKTASTSSHPLGKLALSPESKVALELVGGREAAQPPGFFSMEYDAGKDYWAVFLHSQPGAAGIQPTAIARIALQQHTLFFQWAQGAPRERANGLLNCGLRIVVDGRSHFLPLGRPREVEPVVLNLDAGVGRASLPADWLPPAGTLRFEVLRLDGGFPEPKFKPGNTAAPGQQIDVTFDAKDFPKVWLQIGFVVEPRPMVEVTANVDFQWGNTPPGPFKAKDVAAVLRRMAEEQQNKKFDLDLTPAGDHAAKNTISKQLQTLTEEIDKFNALFSNLQKNPGKVQFRIYTVLEGKHEITLVQSAPAEEPPAR
jgi:hypothetical protein